MKFRHDFKLTKQSENGLLFEEGNNIAQVDFFEHMIRVALLKKDSFLFPTYTVCPGDSVIGREGRDKLSCEGFMPDFPAFDIDDATVTAKTKDVTLSIELQNFRMKVTNENGLLFQDREYISYNFEHELGKGSMHFITREADEKIYGLGDKTGNVNKNRMGYKLGAADAMGFDARTSDPLYKQLPFYICENSNGSYGIYYDTYSNGEISFGKEINNYYNPYKSFRCNEENLVFYIIFGSVAQIVNRFSSMCGPILFPPKWTFKYCGSTMAYTDAPDADHQLREFIELCEKYGISPGGFYLSSGYTQIGEKRYVFHWNLDKVPSPEGLAAHFKEHGVEFLPNIKPAFLTDHPLYEKIASKGWFLHYENGEPAVFPFWSGFGSYLDFTNPEAYDFWSSCVKEQLIDKGYKNPWNDNNEYDICDEEVYAHGFGHPVKACDIRPLFSFLMTMSSLEAQDKSKRTASVSRCGIGGLSRIATTWTGDNNTSFEDFRYNHKMAMTMSLSGFYNFGQDIGGFAGPRPDRELFLRWIQYGIFTPRFTLHSWNPDGSSTMPWLYEDAIPSVKKLFDLREELLLYLYNEVYRSVNTHDPIIYPVFLKYPGYDVESDAFFFGDSILASPVFDRGVDEVTTNLPDISDFWYFDGKPYAGTVTLPAPVDGMPVWFVKAGSVLPIGGKEKASFRIYASKSGTFTYDYLEDDGESHLTDGNHRILHFAVECSEDAVKVEIINATAEDDLDIELIDSKKRKLEIKKN